MATTPRRRARAAATRRTPAAGPRTLGSRLWPDRAWIVPLVALLLFAWTATFPLVWDDVLLEEFIARKLLAGGLPGLLASDFTIGVTVSGYYRPVVLLSLWLDGMVSAQGHGTHHLTNALLHALDSLLVVHLLRGVLGAAARDEAGARARAGALAGGLLFAVHPVHVESVAFVSGRTDLLAALFVLSATLLWWKRRSAPGRASGWSRIGAWISFLLAILSKETSLALPAVLLAWDALRPARATRETWWARNRADLTIWASAAAVAILLRVLSGVKPSPLHPPSAPLLVEMVATYLRLLVAPWPLNAFYTTAHLRLDPVTVAAALALLAGFALLALPRHARLGLLALSWLAAFLAPALAATGPGTAVVAERFLYLPSVALSLVAGYAVARGATPGRARWAVHGLLALAIAAGAALSVARTRVWSDGLTLFLDVTRRSPGYEVGFYNLAYAYRERQMYAEAAAAYREAIRLKSDHPQFHLQLGIVCELMRDYPCAERAYRDAVAASPGFANGYFNLGALYERMDRPGEAVAAYLESLKLRPLDRQALTRVVVLLPRLAPAQADSARRALAALDAPPSRP